MPSTAAGEKKRECDAGALSDLLAAMCGTAAWRHGGVLVVFEKVSAMPGQGVSSMFGFGTSYGIVIGVLAALRLPSRRVMPAVWKRQMGVPAAKDGARAVASRLMPEAREQWRLKGQHGIAEAALLAWWAKHHAQ
jgi:crossover junction endodeoxyribonuclease RuvC